MNIIIKKHKDQALSLETLKAHLRIDHNHEDTYLTTIVDIATELLENSIEKPILEKTYRYTHYSDELSSSKKILLPVSHVKKIISVKRVLANGSREVFLYTTQNYGDKTLLVTNGSKYPIEIEYTAGLTDRIAEIPDDLKLAILHISKNIYECSEADIMESKYIRHIVNAHRPLSVC
ncbi:MAG: head-tail connector protein [Holosporales bacterium]|jgi:uncharacterized phiE125 gp8 family phage protein|nr:head-tail connector protein [Holosporales bacterium]